MRSLWIADVFVVGCTTPGGEKALCQTTAFDGKVVLFGNLHAHSKLSDDIRNAGDDMLPVRAFEYADEHGLDFLAITDHHKAVNSSHRLFMTRDEYKHHLYDAAMQYDQRHAGEFVAMAQDARLGSLQFWRLEVHGDRSAVLTMRADSGENPAITQKIPFTDSPLDEIDIWAGFDGTHWTLYLPSEHQRYFRPAQSLGEPFLSHSHWLGGVVFNVGSGKPRVREPVCGDRHRAPLN